MDLSNWSGFEGEGKYIIVNAATLECLTVVPPVHVGGPEGVVTTYADRPFLWGTLRKSRGNRLHDMSQVWEIRQMPGQAAAYFLVNAHWKNPLAADRREP